MVRSPRGTRVFHGVSLSLQLFRLMNRLVQNPLDPPPLRSICDLKLAAVIPKIGLLGVHYRTSRRVAPLLHGAQLVALLNKHMLFGQTPINSPLSGQHPVPN
jgi:hypothetical protein